VGQRDRHQLGAGACDLVDGPAHRRFDLGIHAGLEVLLGHAHAHTSEAGGAGLPVATHRRRNRSRVEGIVPGDDLQQGGHIFDCPAERPRMIQRRGKRDHAIA